MEPVPRVDQPCRRKAPELFVRVSGEEVPRRGVTFLVSSSLSTLEGRGFDLQRASADVSFVGLTCRVHSAQALG